MLADCASLLPLAQLTRFHELPARPGAPAVITNDVSYSSISRLIKPAGSAELFVYRSHSSQLTSKLLGGKAEPLPLFC